MAAVKIVLATVESSSRPGVAHEVRLGADNAVYCTCERFRFSKQDMKACKHLDAFKAKLVQINDKAAKAAKTKLEKAS